MKNKKEAVTNNVTPQAATNEEPKFNRIPEKIEDLHGWCIVNDARASWLGRVTNKTDNAIALEPAYLYVSQAQAHPNGKIETRRQVFPVEMSPNIERVETKWQSVIECNSFSDHEKQGFVSMIQQAERLKLEIRAQNAGGLTIASAIPPNNGLRIARP